jgi:hypothetical protein
MKRKQRSRRSRSHPRRRTSPPRGIRIFLRPGQRLVTASVIVTARKAGGGGGVSTSVTCECTKAEPNQPDCKGKTTRSPDGRTTTVKCVMSGGCQSCTQTTTTTSSGIFMA